LGYFRDGRPYSPRHSDEWEARASLPLPRGAFKAPCLIALKRFEANRFELVDGLPVAMAPKGATAELLRERGVQRRSGGP